VFLIVFLSKISLWLMKAAYQLVTVVFESAVRHSANLAALMNWSH